MKTVTRINKAIVDVTIRIVVQGNFSDKTIDNAIDNFMTRALQADIPHDLATEGLINARPIGIYHKIYEWEELEEHEI